MVAKLPVLKGKYILQVICVATLALVAELIRCDYGMQGILFIVAFISVKKRLSLLGKASFLLV